MKFLKIIFSNMIASREITGRAYALSALQRLNDDHLRELGYSPEMIARGLAGWPWRNEPATELTAVAPVSCSSTVKLSATAAQTAAADSSANRGHAA